MLRSLYEVIISTTLLILNVCSALLESRYFTPRLSYLSISIKVSLTSTTPSSDKDDNFLKTPGNNSNRKELPKIRSNMNQTKSYFHTISNINNMNPEEENANQKTSSSRKEIDLKNQPKITKIYRLNKEN